MTGLLVDMPLAVLGIIHRWFDSLLGQDLVSSNQGWVKVLNCFSSVSYFPPARLDFVFGAAEPLALL
jgi:hypothetical protein